MASTLQFGYKSGFNGMHNKGILLLFVIRIWNSHIEWPLQSGVPAGVDECVKG